LDLKSLVRNIEAFEPIIQESGSESLGDMIFKQYEHDINVVDTFDNKGNVWGS
jgi:hypothetical protein